MFDISTETSGHSCPIHGSGPTIGGAYRLVSGGRVTTLASTCVCSAGTNIVVSGSATVLANGLPVARYGTETCHGGVTRGTDNRVLVGGSAYVPPRLPDFRADGSIAYGPFIIPGEPRDKAVKSLACLVRLDSVPGGRALIDQIGQSGQEVRLNFDFEGKAETNIDGVWQGMKKALPFLPKPSGSVVNFDPDAHSFGDHGSEHPGADIILAHELIHARENAQPSPKITDEFSRLKKEFRTTGLDSFEYNNPQNPSDRLNGVRFPDTRGEPISENSIRAEYAERGIVAKSDDRKAPCSANLVRSSDRRRASKSSGLGPQPYSNTVRGGSTLPAARFNELLMGSRLSCVIQ